MNNLEQVFNIEYDTSESFQFNLPESNMEQNTMYDASDIFKKYNNDELNQLAGGGLTEEQLQSIRKNGYFAVESTSFPGKYHKWELSNHIQKGTDNIKEDLLNNASNIKRNFDTAFDVTFSFNNGIMNNIKNIGKECSNIIDLLIGIPYKKHKHNKYDARKIIIDDAKKEILENDESLFIFKIDSNDMELLRSKYNNFIKDWNANRYNRLKDIVNSQYQDFSKLSREDKLEFLQNISDIENEQHQECVYKLIEETFSEDEFKCNYYVNIFKNIENIRDEVIDYQDSTKKCITLYEKQLREKYPISSRNPGWLGKKKYNFSKDFGADNIKIDYNLEGINIFNLIFDKINSYKYLEKEDQLLSEQVYKEFDIEIRIWLQKNWHIFENNGYKYLNKYNSNIVTTKYFGWKLGGYWYITQKIFKELGYFSYNSLTRGHFSLRSLFSLNNFYQDKTIDFKTGDIMETRKIKCLTNILRNIYSNMCDDIDDFESKPDNGLFGKSISRIFHRIFVYGKVVLLSILVPIFFVIFTIICFIVNSIILIFLPIIAPLLTLVCTLSDILIYDPIQKGFPLLKIIGKFVVNIMAILLKPASSIILVIIGLLRTVKTIITYLIRYSFDWFIFNAIIRYRARIPGGDTFAARRISGPGLSSTFYYQVNTDLVLLLLEYKLELLMIQNYEEFTLSEINKPMNKLKEHLNSFKPFGLGINHDSEIVKVFGNNNNYLKKILYNKTQEWRNNHPILYIWQKVSVNKNSIRLSDENINIINIQSTELCENFYNNNLKQYILNESKFWNNLKASDSDFKTMAKNLISDVFGSNIFMSLSESDNTFYYNIEEVDFKQYYKSTSTALKDTKMVANNVNHIDINNIPMPKYPLVTPKNLIINNSDKNIANLEKMCYL